MITFQDNDNFVFFSLNPYYLVIKRLKKNCCFYSPIRDIKVTLLTPAVSSQCQTGTTTRNSNKQGITLHLRKLVAVNTLVPVIHCRA